MRPKRGSHPNADPAAAADFPINAIAVDNASDVAAQFNFDHGPPRDHGELVGVGLGQRVLTAHKL